MQSVKVNCMKGHVCKLLDNLLLHDSLWPVWPSYFRLEECHILDQRTLASGSAPRAD